MTNEELVRTYWRAYRTDDREAMSSLRHPDWSVEYPQSRERIRGDANMQAMLEHYPGGSPPRLDEPRFVGSDRWIMTPVFTVQKIVGGGDFWWGDGFARYPDGSLWYIVALIQVRDGKIYRETDYFAAPFDAPAWRAEWVEPMDATEPTATT